MRGAGTIVISDRSQCNGEWRRFVAALCFFEFYGLAVHAGSAVALQYYNPDNGSWLHPDALPWANLAMIVKALTLLAVGRALWLGRGRVWMWLGLAIGGDLFDLAGGISKTSEVANLISNFGGVSVNLPLMVFYACLYHLPWWLMLLLGTWHVRRCSRYRSRSWVVFAAIWAAGITVFNFSAVYSPNPSSHGWAGLIRSPWVDMALTVAPLVAASMLLIHLIWARTMALLLAVVQALANLESGLLLAGLVGIGIKALFIAYNVDDWPWRHVIFNKHLFDSLFVDLPASVGPWLLVAWYAWRVPMKALPDDGSPFPRRYCSRCFYNLHGVEADLCPECGAALGSTEAGPGDVAPRQEAAGVLK